MSRQQDPQNILESLKTNALETKKFAQVCQTFLMIRLVYIIPKQRTLF